MDEPSLALVKLVKQYRELFGRRSIPASILQGETSTERLIATLARAIETGTQVRGWSRSPLPEGGANLLQPPGGSTVSGEGHGGTVKPL